MKLDSHKKISYLWKAMDIIAGVVGMLIFIIMSFAYVYIKNLLPGKVWTSIYFLWAGAAIFYAILILFWKICTQIGNRKFVTSETTKLFEYMAIAGFGEFVCFLAKFVWLLWMKTLSPAVGAFIILEMLLALGFVSICYSIFKLLVLETGTMQKNA